MLNRHLTQEELKKLDELLKLCSEKSFFTFDDLLINGTPVDTIKNYLEQNPSKKFRTWLIDEGHCVIVTRGAVV